MMSRVFPLRFLAVAAGAAALAAGAAGVLLGVCGPFSDISDAVFCPFVLEIFTLEITNGTTATTYSPGDNVTRLQMAAFLSRTVDRSLRRAGKRAALGRFWAPKDAANLGLTALGAAPNSVHWDGKDLWVPSRTTSSVYRVRASDGRLLETWTGAFFANDAVFAMGKVFVDGYRPAPGYLARIDPRAAPGAATIVTSNLGDGADGIAFDGSRIWTANQGASVSIVTPGSTIPWTVTTVTIGAAPTGILFDGTAMWVTDYTNGNLLKLDGNATVLQTIPVGAGAAFLASDGANLWVPLNGGAATAVVRASTGVILATLTGNGQVFPNTAAFDGERILVTNANGDSVSLWKVADLSPIGSVPTGDSTYPAGACSDGINFWITFVSSGQLARF
jgi:hypothetical protein